MKFSRNWLRELLPLDISPNDLARELLLLGFEASNIQTTGPAFEGVVVGKVLEVGKHPNADRLSLCQVSDGSEKLSIVCGAPNVAAGAVVPIAKIGAKLPGGRSIGKSKIRGVESQGMICSASELGVAGDNGGILILPPETALGQDAAKLFGESDTVMEVEVTANRPDCLSHLGLARELSIRFAKDLRWAAPETPVASSRERREVRIEAGGACSRYLGREFSDLRVGPSPAWMARRLEAVGLRPINALVDITNYVLFELGHPIHVFDSDKLQGAVSVRFAKSGERLRALDHKEYALEPSDLVIADASGPAAIAGVIGGEPTGVTEKTTRAFLEAACFDAGSVRRTSKRLKVRTDSSYRFERGTAPESAALASARAARLILELCGSGSAGEASDAYPRPRVVRPIEVSTARVNEILGTERPASEIEPLLRRMSAKLSDEGGKLLFYPPTHRLDLENIRDLAEEAARHIGYDKIPDSPKPSLAGTEAPDPARARDETLRARLLAHGFSEAFNYDFVSKHQLALCGLDPEKASAVEVLNPLSEEWAYLRPSLLPGLLQNAVFNLSRGVENLRLFELGRVFARSAAGVSERRFLAGILVGDRPLHPHWREKPRPVDFYDVKGVVADLVEERSARGASLEAAFFHPKASSAGAYGALHPNLLKAWDIQRPAAAFVIDLSALPERAGAPSWKPLSPFPASRRDLSILVDDGAAFERVRAVALKAESLSRLDLIDVYAGKGIPAGRKSLTLRLTFSRPDRTLRDEEVDASIAKTLEALKKELGAELRS